MHYHRLFTVKKKPLLMVILFSVMLILNTTSLSATNRMSLHRAFADDCYDGNGNYICSDMSDGSSGDSGDSPDGNTGADSSDSDGNSGSDSNQSPTGNDNIDPSDSNPNQGFTDTEQDTRDNSNTKNFEDSTDSESDSDQTNSNNEIQTENGPNSKPVADAGPDLEVDEGDRVVLDGSSSKDNDGSISTYSWNQIDGSPSVDLNDADSSTSSFTAPSVDSNQQLVFHLSVSDNDGSTDGDSVNVLIRDSSPSKNQENTQIPTQSESDSETSEVTPNEKSTPPDNNQSFTNEQEQTNTGPIEIPKADQVQEIENKSNSPETTTIAPDCTENQTECNANKQNSGEVDCMDSKFANDSECNSSPPITPCTENYTSCNPSELSPLPCNENMTGDGCNPENPPNPCIRNMTGDGCNPTPNPCTGNMTGVKDNQTDCNPLPRCPINMTAGVECEQPLKNIPPVADAGKDQEVEEGSKVILDGSGSHDPDGNISSSTWVEDVGNSSIVINDADSLVANFEAPQVNNDTNFKFILTVSDSGNESSSDEVNILVRNTNNTVIPPLEGRLTLDAIPNKIDAGSIFVFSGQLEITGVTAYNNSNIQIKSITNESDNDVLSFNAADNDGRYVSEWTATPNDSPYKVQAIYEDSYGRILRSNIQSFEVVENKSEILTMSKSLINGPYIPLIFNDYNREKLNVYVKYDDASAPYVSTAVAAIKHWSKVLQERSGNNNAWQFNIVTAKSFRNTPGVNILVNLKHENNGECPGWTGGCTHNNWLLRLWNGHLLIYVYTGIGSQDSVSYITSHEFGHALGLGHTWNEGDWRDTTADMMCSQDYKSTFLGVPTGPLVETCETSTDIYHDRGQPSEFDVRAILYNYGNDGFQTPNLKLYGNDIYVCQPLPCEPPSNVIKPKEPKPVNPIPKNPPKEDVKQTKKKTTTVTTTTEEKPKVVPYLNNYGLVNKIGTFGSGPGQFNHPASIAADPNGQRFYISDLDNNRIQVVQSDGDSITSWGTLGAGKGQFDGPGAVTIDDEHKLVFVSDIKNNRVEKFDIQGKYLGQWGTLGRSEGQFDHPGDIALDPEEEKLYVTDIYNNRIQAFYYDGNFVDSWGTFGSATGQFNRPAGITINPEDNLIYVSDTANNRIQVFDTDGKFVKKWGSHGLGDGQFARPDGIFFEPTEKLIYIADRQNHRIQVFDDQGKFVAKWGVSDTTGNPVKPRDIVIDSSGRVYVVDKVKSEIDVFGTGHSIQKTQDMKTTTTKTTTTKTNIDNGRDGNDGKSDNSRVKKNDPCNYYGLDICDKDRKGCDAKRFDCLSDNCNNGQPGTTGLCNNDDRPYKKSGDDKGNSVGGGNFKGEYKIKAFVRLEDSCWNNIVFKFTDSKTGSILGQKSVKGDATFDDNPTEASVILAFNPKDVKSGNIKGIFRVDGHSQAPYFSELDLAQHTYDFDFTSGQPAKTDDRLCFAHQTD